MIKEQKKPVYHYPDCVEKVNLQKEENKRYWLEMLLKDRNHNNGILVYFCRKKTNYAKNYLH